MSLLAGQHQPPDPGADTAGLSAFKAVGSQLAVSAGQSIFNLHVLFVSNQQLLQINRVFMCYLCHEMCPQFIDVVSFGRWYQARQQPLDTVPCHQQVNTDL